MPTTTTSPPSSPPPHTQCDLLVIGAGIHGLALLHTYLTAHRCLFSSSFSPNIILLDATPPPHTVGGVWSSARLYPGLKTNNLLGSYEFSDYPLEPGKYGVKAGQHIPGEVVGAYLGGFVQERGMGKYVKGGMRVVSAQGLSGMDMPDVRQRNGESRENGWRVVARRMGNDRPAGDTAFNEGRGGGAEVEVFYTKSLAVCTGSTSLPNMPRFEGQEQFTRLVMHSADLPTALPKLLGMGGSDRGASDNRGLRAGSEDEKFGKFSGMRHFVVIGGNKSAFDAAYALAMGLSPSCPSECAPKTTSVTPAPTDTRVTILLRPSGGGPSWVWPRFITPFKLSVQRLATTRLFALLDPTPWSRYRWLRWLLHCTLLGQWLVGIWWRIVANFILAGRGEGVGEEEDMAGVGGVDSKERRRRVDMFKPWTGLEWVGNSLSVDNYDEDFWELVRNGRVTAAIAEVKELRKEGGVWLSDGSVLEDVQGIVCCTGWKTKPSFRWLPEGIEDELGLPGSRYGEIRKSKSDIDLELAKKTEQEAINKQVLAATPTLKQRPVRRRPVHPATTASPAPPVSSSADSWRLYRNLIPVPSSTGLEHGKIAFLGTHLSVATTLVAQAQALWATAYFLDRPIQEFSTTDMASQSPPLLPLPSPTTMRCTMLKDVEYQRLRHPAEAGGAGERCADLVFDSLGYVDLLLEDLGLESRRKAAARRRRKELDAGNGAGGESLVSRLWEGAVEQWEELTQRYWPADYRGMVEEWADLVKLRRSDGADEIVR